jgi:hypothetical protein
MAVVPTCGIWGRGSGGKIYFMRKCQILISHLAEINLSL